VNVVMNIPFPTNCELKIVYNDVNSNYPWFQ